MPFDPAPITKVGRFQHIADAMLRGCQMSGQCYNGIADNNGNTCAYGALLLATGRITLTEPWESINYTEEELRMAGAYHERYGSTIADNNDYGEFTREQIAERIAAL